jgi:hypothetical protein
MQIRIGPPTIEARTWLRNNSDTSAFATNRFQTTENALAFVEKLYALGTVEVLLDDPMIAADGRPYADTLWVRIPDEWEIRHALTEFCEEEGLGDLPPGDFTMHFIGEDQLRLWWD